jgi:hypothetical protein
MTLQLKNVIGVLALATSTTVTAQAQTPAQQTTSTTTQQTPDQTQTSTTNSTTTAVPGTPATPAQTQTTTTRSTTTTPTDTVTGQPTGPSQSSTTTATTTTNAAAAKPAIATDVKAGVSVYDQNGGLVGKVESVTSKGAVVNTGTVRASIPVSSFAKNDKGLVIAMTKADINAAAKKSTTKPK